MFGFKPKLPIADDLREWVDEGFERLAKLLGRDTLLQAQVVLPNDSFFPDAFDGSKESVAAMAVRVAGYMGVAPESFVVEVYAEDEERWQASIPLFEGRTSDAAGLYFHRREGNRSLIGVHAGQLKKPEALAATLAHELAHVLLLGGGLMAADTNDLEPMTDLATVFLGMGVFTSAAAYRFEQWSDGGMQGWSSGRQGYLPEPMWGYALAKFADLRGETRPPWASELQGNIRDHFDPSAKWLQARLRKTG